jgi:hypothetical protein
MERGLAIGAYGLRIGGLPDAAVLMQPVAADATRLVITTRVCAGAVGPERPSEVSSEHADVRLRWGGRMRMRHGLPEVEYAVPVPLGSDELLHPYLAPAAALAQLWEGHEALHAGAFVVGEGAIILLGGKERGKSTTLAWIAARHRMAVLADDLCVIVDGHVLAGPRCLDVRSHPEIDVGDGKLVRDARHRIALEPVPDAVPIVGIVELEWAARPELVAVPVDQRFARLFAQRMFNVHLDLDPVALLGLLAVPMLTLARPTGAAGLAAGVELLLERFS